MAISGFTPTALPGLVPGAQLAGSNPLLAAQGGTIPTTSQLAAQAAVGEKPGIAARLMNAMRAAVSELRGMGASDAQIQQQMLALQAQAQQPVTLAKQATVRGARTPKGKTWTDRQGNLREVGTGKVLKPATGASQHATSQPGAAAQQPVGSTLPSNATTLPGATMYSYDANGNPVAAPTMQQLGVTPTMLQGLTGLAGAVDPDGPQVNATNQTNLSGIGAGMGSQVPVLGAPIVTRPVTSPGDDAPTTPHNGSTGGTQAVTNRNTTDVNNRNQGFGYGYGGWGDPMGGVATPYSPYGASMTGAYALGHERPGFFSRLFR